MSSKTSDQKNRVAGAKTPLITGIANLASLRPEMLEGVDFNGAAFRDGAAKPGDIDECYERMITAMRLVPAALSARDAANRRDPQQGSCAFGANVGDDWFPFARREGLC